MARLTGRGAVYGHPRELCNWLGDRSLYHVLAVARNLQKIV